MPPCVLFPYRVIDRSKTRFSKRKDKYGEASSPGDTFSLHHTGTCDKETNLLPKMPNNSFINREVQIISLIYPESLASNELNAVRHY